MELTPEEQAMLAGDNGPATRKAMQILVTLGTIYGARRMLPVASVQVSGVSYDNLGEAGLEFLAEMAAGGGRAQALTTLNPAGVDVEEPQPLGIGDPFVANQRRVLEAYTRTGILPTCTCTPYLVGNLPRFGQSIAWAESSAVCMANAVLGARTNREGGPGALAAALTGRTPEYGYHLDEARQPTLTVVVQARPAGTSDFGALGRVIGERLACRPDRPVPFIRGLESASLEELKSFCASIATYGNVALFHIEGITPEAIRVAPPDEISVVWPEDLARATAEMSDATPDEVDFVTLGCPHLSLREIARLADLLRGRRVRKEFWITTARFTKQMAEQMGYAQTIAESGAKFAVDTCCVVAPIRGRFTALATDSAKACAYARARHGLKCRLLPFEAVVEEALR